MLHIQAFGNRSFRHRTGAGLVRFWRGSDTHPETSGDTHPSTHPDHTSGVSGKTKDYHNFSDIKNKGIKYISQTGRLV